MLATTTGKKRCSPPGSWGGDGKGKVYAGNEHKDFFHLSRLGQPSPDAHRTRPSCAGPSPAQPSPAAARGPRPSSRKPQRSPVGLTSLLIGLSEVPSGCDADSVPPGPRGCAHADSARAQEGGGPQRSPVPPAAPAARPIRSTLPRGPRRTPPGPRGLASSRPRGAPPPPALHAGPPPAPTAPEPGSALPLLTPATRASAFASPTYGAAGRARSGPGRGKPRRASQAPPRALPPAEPRPSRLSALLRA